MDSKTSNFSDRYETDENGNQVLFTVELQRRLSNAGLPIELASLDQLQGSAAPAARPVEREVQQQPAAPPPPKVREAKSEEISEPGSIQIDPKTGKYVGRLKWYNARKGYGFIMRGAGEEIFFHRSNSTADPEVLSEGQWILYDVEETNKGPEAADVEAYDGEPPLN